MRPIEFKKAIESGAEIETISYYFDQFGELAECSQFVTDSDNLLSLFETAVWENNVSLENWGPEEVHEYRAITFWVDDSWPTESSDITFYSIRIL